MYFYCNWTMPYNAQIGMVFFEGYSTFSFIIPVKVNFKPPEGWSK